ncbi:MAG: hypothetical protein EXR07_07235 [Acetobacteraceae bacterium]|nr:hypothetical protein [Acetobacteraceae bacterium]
MPFKEPFELGPFSVDAEGGLSLIRRDVPGGFSVRWRGRAIHARLERSGDSGGHLHIQANLGRIPSTVSDPEARAECLTLLRGLRSALPEAWQVRLLPDHREQLQVYTVVVLPITVTNLVTELAAFVLDLEPWLDLIDQSGSGSLATIAGSPGAAPVRSGFRR